MFGECHMHMFMNGVNYREAVNLHKSGVQDSDIRCKLEQYRKMGITFIRDGGDALGVSTRAAQLAPEYGITYRTPLFAIHKKGHYGGIVGYAFENWKEYRGLIDRSRKEGGDFIKVMFSGILDFGRDGALTEESLDREEIREMIHIAHEEGFAVMAHVNGADAVKAAAEAGVDSVEHSNFADEECLYAMAEHHTIWVPTYVTITNLIGSGRFDDASLCRLRDRQGALIRRGMELGVTIAAGSDAGAYRVPHGQGLYDEYCELRRLAGLQVDAHGTVPAEGEAMLFGQGQTAVLEICPPPAYDRLMTAEEFDLRLAAAENEVRRRFARL